MSFNSFLPCYVDVWRQFDSIPIFHTKNKIYTYMIRDHNKVPQASQIVFIISCKSAYLLLNRAELIIYDRAKGVQ